jgi:putative endonuclease
MKFLDLLRGRARRSGAFGEARARAFLEKKGYRFLDGNFLTKFGEVDLVMRQGDCVVFVEVKRRGRSDYGLAQEFVDAKKQAKVVKAALAYVKLKDLGNSALRFDVVALGENDAIDHIENAFAPPPGRYTL